MKNIWVSALGIMLILEGVIPLFFPTQWRETFRRIIQFEDGQIRFFGLISMLCGLVIIYFFLPVSD